jgi:hypothetical protein
LKYKMNETVVTAFCSLSPKFLDTRKNVLREIQLNKSINRDHALNRDTGTILIYLIYGALIQRESINIKKLTLFPFIFSLMLLFCFP